MRSDLTVIIPLRGRNGSKTRLAERFDPAQRTDLVQAMTGMVLDAVLGANVASRILLVTRDPVFASESVGSRHEIEIVTQPESLPGLNSAVDLGRGVSGAGSHLILFADLPLVAPGDIRLLCASPLPVVIGRDRHGTGTNALLVRGDECHRFRFAFGAGSYARHREEAERLGMRLETIDTPGIGFDLDTIPDWYELPVPLRSRLMNSVDMLEGDYRMQPVRTGERQER
jgi:2-phospho-L-lactate guanylyltransferase